MDRKHLALALFMSIVFGMGWVLAKSVLDVFPPILLAGFRFATAALALIWFVKPPLGRMRELAIISFLAISIPYSLSYTGMQGLDVSTTVLLVQLEAPTLILFAAILLREIPGLRKCIGTGIAFLGVVLIAGDPRMGDAFFAVFLVLASIATWALGQIRIRRLGAFGGLRNVAWISAFASPQLFILSAVLETGQVAAITGAGGFTWMVVLYLGIVMTAAGIGAWYHLIGAYPMALVSPFLLLVPVTGVLGGVLWLGETLTLRQSIGGAIVVLGVAIVLVERRARAGATCASFQSEDKNAPSNAGTKQLG